jgi:hypothetical protein
VIGSCEEKAEIDGCRLAFSHLEQNRHFTATEHISLMISKKSLKLWGQNK